MGEVYRAKDSRLGREVAVKVLPAHLTADPDLKARFEREARAISQLTHPHICTLYDVGSEGGVEYLVMELLEGQTLADRLEKGPLPTEQALRIGVEIADALDRAHRAGIVHRDLKPGNVMLTKSGVKLLDFGLAKTAEATEISELSSLPTQASHPLTARGTVMGTFQYMAPEQLEGRNADARTDLFALGCVLYEMATGKRAFSGDTQASLISAIMTKDPEPISAVVPLAPPTFDRLVRTCLAKDPEDRWQSARDVRNEITWIAQSGSQAGAAAPATAPFPRRSRERLAWGAAILFAALAAAAVLTELRSSGRIRDLSRPFALSIALPEATAVRGVALSPDGRRLAFVARDPNGQSLLWMRPIDSTAARPLPETDNPSFPFWSPDGRFVAFFSQGKLKKIDVAGGPPQTICEAPEGRGASWSRDGVIVLAPRVDGPLFRVPASGGVPTQITALDRKRGETSHRWPFFLPDGRHFLYLVANFASPGNVPGMGIFVRDLESNEEALVSTARSSIGFVPSGGAAGSLLFYADGNLMEQPFDGRRTTGEPTPIAEGIQYFPQTQYALFSASDDRTIVYQARAASGVSQLAWFDRSGRQTGTLGALSNQANPRISPDGARVALDITDPQSGNTDVWIYQASGGIPTRFTSHPAIDALPVWSPDGDRLAWDSLRQAHPDLYVKNASGIGEDMSILVDARTKYPTDWSRDGRYLLFRSIELGKNFELWYLPMSDPDRTPVAYLRNTFGFSHGQFSPDGRWVAYASNESGRWEVYVSAFPVPGGNWKISTAGGSEPRWRRDGKEIFYLAPDGKLMAVPVNEGPPFEAGTATGLFQTRRRERISATDLFSYDVSPDGNRFLVGTDVGEVASSPLNVLVHLPVEGKRP